ncbi:NADP-dependent oxidoreductase [Cryobacterium lactosi]|uniref:NADP-dependent oxidoreductase n=1 Tax=Cryobacterium lactosi TaxID=1259202 RepID=A0A4R9BM78_9MICO|nr:NADP-dependent oxidoreductase [Cryobacterium lactosi]TFD87038.1 NADP-dependent oxidoreductase [Cryobacterium lactosi]
MQAALYHNFGDPDVLVVEEVTEPHASANSVRIAVKAVSVNTIDYLFRAGTLQDVLPLTLPAIPGRDAVGIIDEVGEGVTDSKVGDLVFGLGGVSDTTAEFAVLTAWSAVPPQWSIEQAAAAGLASATAAGAINALGDLNGRTLLIEGASGAVGSAATALAIAAGATVIGTARPANHHHVTALGAAVTTYGPGLAERVAALAPEGVFAALHAAPSPALVDLVSIVGDKSRVVSVVGTGEAVQHGVVIVNAVNDSTLLEQTAGLGRRGLYTPRVDRVVPLRSIREAHELASGGAGKVVVIVS